MTIPDPRLDGSSASTRPNILRVVDALLIAAGGLVVIEAARYFVAQGARGRFHVEGPLFILVALCGAAPLVGQIARIEPRGAEDEPYASSGPLPHPWALFAAALCAAVVLYWPALSIGYLSDDFALENRIDDAAGLLDASEAEIEIRRAGSLRASRVVVQEKHNDASSALPETARAGSVKLCTD